MRKADEQAERDALDVRHHDAITDAQSRGCLHEFQDFETTVAQTAAIMCLPIGVANKIVQSDNPLFKTFYLQVAAGSRYPQDNVFDQGRTSVDSNLFPLYHDLVRFAALSLDGDGPLSYGTCSIKFRTASIAHRASVFEKNSFVFYQERSVPAAGSPPPGYRAAWPNRGKLAATKYYGVLAPGMLPTAYPGIILRQTGSTDTDEFIEVHIYGTLDLKSVESARLHPVMSKPDQKLQRGVHDELEREGIPCQVL